jgi:hypothetical protein
LKTPYRELLALFGGLSADDWLDLDAFKLRKLLTKAGLEAPPWFMGAPRAAAKFRDKGFEPKTMGSTELAEMASRAVVARLRFGELSPFAQQIRSAAFPASGAGMDWLVFREMFGDSCPFTFGGDIDFGHSWCSAVNLKSAESSSPKAAVLCYDALREPFAQKSDYVFLDPARRQGGQRQERFQYRPELEAALASLEQHRFAQIKLAPGERPERLMAMSERGWRFTWVQLGSDLLECFGTWSGPNSDRVVSQAVCLGGSGAVLGRCSGEAQEQVESYGPEPQPGEVVVWPPKVLMHVGLCQAWAEQRKLEPSGLYPLYLGDGSKTEGLGECYRVLSGVHTSAKALKKELLSHGSVPVEIKKLSGEPLPKAFTKTLASLLKQKGAPEDKLTLAFACERGRVQGLVLKRVV